VYSACLWKLYRWFHVLHINIWVFPSNALIIFIWSCLSCFQKASCAYLEPPICSVKVLPISVRLNSPCHYGAWKRMDGIIRIRGKWFPVSQTLTSISRSSVVNVSILVVPRHLVVHGRWWFCHKMYAVQLLGGSKLSWLLHVIW